MTKEEIQNVTEHLVNVITSSEILIYEIDELKKHPEIYSGGLKVSLRQAHLQLIKYTKKVYDLVDSEEGANRQFSDLYSNYSELLHKLAKMSIDDRVDISTYIKENYENREKSMDT